MISACSYEFNNLRECYSRCGGKEPCKLACRYHESQSRIEIELEDYKRNLSNPYPPDIYELVDKRENDTLHVSHLFVGLHSFRFSVVVQELQIIGEIVFQRMCVRACVVTH